MERFSHYFFLVLDMLLAFVFGVNALFAFVEQDSSWLAIWLLATFASLLAMVMELNALSAKPSQKIT